MFKSNPNQFFLLFKIQQTKSLKYWWRVKLGLGWENKLTWDCILTKFYWLIKCSHAESKIQIQKKYNSLRKVDHCAASVFYKGASPNFWKMILFEINL